MSQTSIKIYCIHCGEGKKYDYLSIYDNKMKFKHTCDKCNNVFIYDINITEKKSETMNDKWKLEVLGFEEVF